MNSQNYTVFISRRNEFIRRPAADSQRDGCQTFVHKETRAISKIRDCCYNLASPLRNRCEYSTMRARRSQKQHKKIESLLPKPRGNFVVEYLKTIIAILYFIKNDCR